MKKKKLKSLALLGIATGMLVSNHLEARGSTSENIQDGVLLASQCGKGKCGGAKAGCAGGCGTSSPKTLSNASCASCAHSTKSIAEASCASCAHSHKTIANASCASCSHSAKAIAEADSKKSLTDPVPLTKDDPNAGNITYHLMTEDELLVQLNDDGVKLYNSLSPEGKALAREVASQACNGANNCKGLNACKSDKNACAGQGSCKGKSICGMGDKNLAVKIAAKKMAEKREALSQPK